MFKKVLDWFKMLWRLDWFKMLWRKVRGSKRIILPDREEMLKRFEKDRDHHRQKYFYPVLLKEAGQKKNTEGIIKMLAQAIAEYVEKIPLHMRGRQTGIIFTQAGNIIDMLVEDKEVGKTVKGFLETIAEEFFTVVQIG